MDGANLEPGHFRAVLDVLPVAVYCTDAAGFLTYFNPAAIESQDECRRRASIAGALPGNCFVSIAPRSRMINARWRLR